MRNPLRNPLRHYGRRIVPSVAVPVAQPPRAARRGLIPRGLSAKLAMAYALVAAMTALFAGVISFAMWAQEFQTYIQANLQILADDVAAAAGTAYGQSGDWGFATLGAIPQVGGRAEIAVQILDENGDVVYDEAKLRTHAQMMVEAFSGGAATPTAEEPTLDTRPTGAVVTSPVMVGGDRVGTVRVWPYGHAALETERDIQLRAASLAGLIIAGFIAVVVASLAGAAYSRRVVRPINRISATARALRGGERSARTGLTGSDEISQLGETFDSMASAIQAERELERRLTSDVAHELRTPLMAIQATVEAMEDGVLPADAEHLGRVQSETQRLSRLTNAILELSRLEAGSGSFDLEPLDPSLPIRAALDTHEALFDAVGLTVTTELASGLTVRADSDRLQQAVGNFLSNAARYTPEGGQVTVTLAPTAPPAGEEPGAGWCVIKVSDTGIGISAEDRDKMFRRFWRADAARNRETGGLGIGLAIAKEIVDRHRGFIQVESEVGVGTSFAILLPLA